MSAQEGATQTLSRNLLFAETGIFTLSLFHTNWCGSCSKLMSFWVDHFVYLKRRGIKVCPAICLILQPCCETLNIYHIIFFVNYSFWAILLKIVRLLWAIFFTSFMFLITIHIWLLYKPDHYENSNYPEANNVLIALFTC